MEKEKLLDDQEFANAFVRDRMEFSTKGPQILIQELIKKRCATSASRRSCCRLYV
ncbi:RecX family transcriptional regulator [Virgibacillus halophilus]|uniref:Regulatory protein RecX n=1 Tax=Tigheibacillus halophilus TaxID=361280 RepID=A0ABU5C8Z2_9BACI|nr:RecX family transcriptional regulator [Virgibacillus halophilus]